MSEADGADLLEAAGRASDWLRQRVLPYWTAVGVDGRNGFVEHLTLKGTPAEVSFKRLRVQARQIYVFSHAYVNGYGPGIDAAANGWTFMRTHGWTPDGHWARVLGRAGGVLDPTADLYDHAFALLGIAWWIRASGDDALPWAEQTLEAVDRCLATADSTGWWSEQGPRASLLQNPHMHLLEACLAAHEVTGAATFKSYAERIVSLFESRLFDAKTGTLAERFDDNWQKARGEPGRLVEPGHHYEWVWLLCSAMEVIPSAATNVEALFEFAERFGCDPASGLVYDHVLDDGSVASPGYRLWPNTEALKAHVAWLKFAGRLDPTRIVQILTNLFTYYLGRPRLETWIDQLDGRRHPCVDKIPASSLYHLHLAIAEMARAGPAFRAITTSAE